MPNVAFYHYTDTRGKDGIVSSGYIREKPAGNKYAHFGPGTYGTSLAPSAGKRRIAENNWKSHWQSNIQNGRMDWAIVVQVPANMVRRYGSDQGRDILVYDGRLSLNNYGYQIVRGPTS
ncbi:hypothetical protein V1264_011488 [Littorina saxatilis]|uniref:Tox-ART-HYD1 domain-containing protein n=1 Tax=Littorina saxatilis TaxID=31220 RepID=A0AAN9BV19_9CAEN